MHVEHTANSIDALNPSYAGKLGSGRIDTAAAVSIAPQPILTLKSTAVNGDPLGRPTQGERSSLAITLSNDWLNAMGTIGTLTTTDPLVTIHQQAASFGDIPAGGIGVSTPVYTFSVALAAGYNHSIPFLLQVSANSGVYTATLPLTITTRSANEPVGGTISENKTWTNDKTYLVQSNLVVADGVTLTIQAGTEILFTGNFNFSVGGTLIADGTQSQPIRFRGQSGNSWGRIYYYDFSVDAVTDISGTYQSGNILRWAQIENASQGIYCQANTPYITHVTLTGGGLNCTLGETAFWLQDNNLTNGVAVSRGGQVWRNNISGGSLNLSGRATVHENTVNGGITVGSSSDVQDNATDGLINAPGTSIVENNTISSGGISTGDSSIVQENEVSGGGISTGSSSSVMSNTVTGGGITLGSGCIANRNNIENATNWGISTSGSVTLTFNRIVGGANGVSLSGGIMRNNLVANNNGVGLQINGNTTLISNTFTGNKGNTIKLVFATSLILHGNNLEGNKGTYDIENLIPKTTYPVIPAKNNWWGTTSDIIIMQRIHDWKDGDLTLGQVDYSPASIDPIQNAPAYLRSVTLTPPSPVGIETVSFYLLFSKPMDFNYHPELSFIQSSGLFWRTLSDPTIPRYALGVAYPGNGKIYAIGGHDGINPIATVEEYNLSEDIWSFRANMSYARYFLGTTVGCNGKIYAINGATEGDPGSMEEYDPATDNWSIRSRIPTPRFAFGVVTAANCKIYAIGGNYDGNLSTVEEYDPETDTWITKVSMPTPRSYLGVTSANNGKIYAIGGGTSDTGNVVEEYDPTTNTWRARADMPTPRQGLAVVTANNGKIYAIGGRDNKNMDFLSSVEEYDPTTNTWTSQKSMPYAMGYLGATLANGKIYAIAWRNEELNFPYISTTDFYDLQWISEFRSRINKDISILFPRDTYTLTIKNAIGSDGIEIAPNIAYTFTVDYAGAIGDTTPPPPPEVKACAASSQDTLSASWIAHDPESAITLYRYAIGTTAGTSDMVNWTNTTDASFLRSGLGLIAGQTYYASIKARHAGGLWSTASTPPGVVAGSNQCTVSHYKIYLPSVRR